MTDLLAALPPNLFQGDWTVGELEPRLAEHPRRPLLPPFGSARWRKAAANPWIQKLVAPLRARGARECGEPLPSLTDELYASFRKTGVRLTFENVYFERRRQLARAALGLLLAPDHDAAAARFRESMIEKLRAIFEEESWALPAHVNWDNTDPSGKDSLQIDLFCAETANLMAEMLDVFGAILPSELTDAIRKRLLHSVFENYLARDFHWMEVTHNWNAVCHQGVIGAALSQVDDPSLLALLLNRMREKLPRFLDGFGPDGGCSEGVGYWSYGFGWFTVLNEQLETRTSRQLSLFDGDPKIRAIALFGPRMALKNGFLVNFADGPAAGGLNPAVVTYLAERLEEVDCRAAAAEQYRRWLTDGIPMNSERADVFSLFRQVLRCPSEFPPEPAAPADVYLPDLAVVVARSEDRMGRRWEFAAKGGHNAEHHNHNDCGSYLLNIAGSRLVTEIGAPEYVHDFFGPKRYEFLAARSRGHSLPIVNGCEQSAGAEFSSRVLDCWLDETTVIFAVDLTAAYPAEAGLRRLVRTFFWDKWVGYLRITDEFELKEPGRLESALITDSVVERRETLAEIRGNGVTLQMAAGPGVQFKGVETCEYRGRLGEELAIHRLTYGLREPAAHGAVAITLLVK